MFRVSGARVRVHGLLFMNTRCHVWCMVDGGWCMVYGLWFLVYGL